VRVLTVYAHPNPKSFCHAVLDRFTAGLRAAGHTADVDDLYAIGFDPVFRMRDNANWVHEDMPADILERMQLRERVLESARGPIQRMIATRALRGKDDRQIARMLREHGPKDAAKQWQRVAQADALAFIAPIFWLAFPAMLKGWFERVLTYNNAFALTREGWEGDVRGRIPLLHHEKALIITPTLFCEQDYDDELRAPITQIVDDWGLRYPGVKRVEHVYFYRAAVADQDTIRGYLERSYELGERFADPSPAPSNAAARTPTATSNDEVRPRAAGPAGQP
jgi:NAD(P)H dehydrogenase (quinone)